MYEFIIYRIRIFVPDNYSQNDQTCTEMEPIALPSAEKIYRSVLPFGQGVLLLAKPRKIYEPFVYWFSLLREIHECAAKILV